MVLFEIPTGVIADTRGRRVSYLLGTITLAGSTLLYYFMWQMSAPFWAWAVVSMLIGLGFTFFSGAVEAWLVDALHFSGYDGPLEAVFGRGQMVGGVAMLGGSVAGGVIAQTTSLGVPFLLRVGVLVVMFVVAFVVMKDLGFTPERTRHPLRDVQAGFLRLDRQWLEEPAGAVGDAGGAVQRRRGPLRLLRHAAVPARAVRRRTGLQRRGAGGGDRRRCSDSRRLPGSADPRPLRPPHVGADRRHGASVLLLVGLGLTRSFALALFFVVLWGIVFAAVMPIRQAYLNGMIASEQRATVLSFDSLMGNTGGVVIQPALGRAADVWSYGTSYVIGAGIQALAVPFLLLSRRENAPADTVAAPPERTEVPNAA